MNTLRHFCGAAIALMLAGTVHAQEPVPKPVEDQGAYNRGRPPDKPKTPVETSDDPAAAGPSAAGPSATGRTDEIWPRGTSISEKESGQEDPVGSKEGTVQNERNGETEAARERPRESDPEYAACRLALSHLGTVYEERPEITEKDNPDCGIAKPLHVTEILPGLELEGGAIMRCDTARALGFWAQEFLRPASVSLPGSPRLTALQLGTHYDCRARNGTKENQPKLSEHALGNAIDIAGFVFDQGPPVPVEPREDNGDLYEAFQRAARASACLYFSTVLGPGSNAAHDNHLHLDVISRKNGWRLCQ